MAVDAVTLIAFESGEMDTKEIVEMLSEMVESGEIDVMDDKFRRLADYYTQLEILDEEGNINYIKLREEV
jgi:hypothetical protein